jgi:cysteine desulfuration protein SufE
MSTSPAFDDIAENLSFLDDWEDRYRYLIELGQDLAPLTPRAPATTSPFHIAAIPMP